MQERGNESPRLAGGASSIAGGWEDGKIRRRYLKIAAVRGMVVPGKGGHPCLQPYLPE